MNDFEAFARLLGYKVMRGVAIVNYHIHIFWHDVTYPIETKVTEFWIYFRLNLKAKKSPEAIEETYIRWLRFKAYRLQKQYDALPQQARYTD